MFKTGLGTCFNRSKFANFVTGGNKMKKKIMAVVLTVALCTMMSANVLAANPSQSTSGSSGTSAPAETPANRGTVNTDDVSIAVPNADGSVSRVNLTAFTAEVSKTVVAVAAANAANPGEAVSSVLSAPASEIFKATINVLGGNIRTVNAGGYKVVSAAPAVDGRTVASVGTVKGVTKYAFVILTAVNADGTVEIVEGTVDPVTLQVMGVFRGTPKAITVSVIVAK